MATFKTESWSYTSFISTIRSKFIWDYSIFVIHTHTVNILWYDNYSRSIKTRHMKPDQLENANMPKTWHLNDYFCISTPMMVIEWTSREEGIQVRELFSIFFGRSYSIHLRYKFCKNHPNKNWTIKIFGFNHTSLYQLGTIIKFRKKKKRVIMDQIDSKALFVIVFHVSVFSTDFVIHTLTIIQWWYVSNVTGAWDIIPLIEIWCRRRAWL